MMAAKKSKSQHPVFNTSKDSDPHKQESHRGRKTSGSHSSQFGTRKQVLPQIKKMSDRFDDMIAGCLNNLPPKPPSEVRIFLSSTFSDMRAERNALARMSYPQIKDYCYSNLDLDFQVVDLRWGINSQATNNHVTGKICMREIENCQKVSLGPNFVTILSHRYGQRALRAEIDSDEFDIIMKELITMDIEEYNKLTTWYLKDDNNIPPVYILQPIDSIIPGFGSEDPDVSKKSEQDWNMESSILKKMLHQGVTSAHKKGLVTDVTQDKYLISVTEEEVEKGILQASNPGSHSECFIRKLTGIGQDQLSDTNATRYFETVKCNGMLTIDEKVTACITDLQNEKIPKKLPKGNIHIHKVPWHDGGILPDKDEAHKRYIENLCREFTYEVISMIEAEKHLRENQIPTSEYYTDFDELLHHLYFCKTKCENFKGRKEILKNVEKYLMEKKNHKPLVIHAESGAGKTSVMAMIMKNLPKWFGSGCIRVIRFLGTSPDSTEIFGVLFAIVRQLADDFDMILEPVGYKNIKSLVKYLPRFLRNVSRSSKEHVFILLDSVDQLSPADNAHSMYWLPRELPKNIHIILSMLPDRYGCLDKTLSLLNNDKNCFLELKPLGMETGIEIINQYLTKHGRTVKDKSLILDDLKNDPKPLFLKLLLDQALEWRSYKTEHKSLHNVRHAIETLFTDIENQCGRCATRALIGYLTCGLNGLTELELEDVLSLDDEVLDSLYVYHDPPVDGIIHMPSIVLKRILYMLREYIVERRSQNKKTLYWYHRQFTEYALDYVKQDMVKLHKTLTELYVGEVPVKRTMILTSRRKTLEDVNRQITLQPLTSKNKRKLQALPYHLRNIGNLDQLKKHCLCNLKFMMCKLEAFSLGILLKDYLSAKQGLSADDVEISLMMRCLKDMKDTISANSLPLELLARLPENKKTMLHISNLLMSCKQELKTGRVVSLMPVYPCLGNLSQQRLIVHNVEKIVGTSSDFTKLLLECRDAAFPERSIWQVVIGSFATVQSIPKTESVLPPIVSKDGSFVLTFQWNSGKTGIKVDLLNIDKLENVVSYDVSSGINPNMVTCINMCNRYLTVAANGLQVRTFILKDDVNGNNAREMCTFCLDLDGSEDLEISSVFRIQLDKSAVHYVSVVTNKGDPPSCIETLIVITSVVENSKPKQLSVVHLSGKALSKNIVFLQNEGINKTLLLSTVDTTNDIYRILCCDISKGTVLQEVEFMGIIQSCDIFPDIILASTIAVPSLVNSRWNLKMISILDDMKSEIVGLECVDCPFCTFVTVDGYVGYCDRGGGLYLAKVDKDVNRQIVFRLCSITVDVVMSKVYLNVERNILSALRDDKKLGIWSWKDMKENLVNESLIPMSTRPYHSDDQLEKAVDNDDSVHLGNDEQVLSVLISRDELQIWTLDRDCCIRAWHLSSCRFSHVITTINNDVSLESGELCGSIHSIHSERSCCAVYLPKSKELTMLCRGLSTKQEIDPQMYNNVAAYYLDINKADLQQSKLYVLKELSSNRYILNIYSWPYSHLDKTINIKDLFTGRVSQIKPTYSRRHMVFAVECSEKELEKSLSPEKNKQTERGEVPTKCYTVNLSKLSDELTLCYRELTKIERVAVSTDGRWMASYCEKDVLKLLDDTGNVEYMRIALGHCLVKLFFSQKYLIIHGTNITGCGKVFIFEVFTPDNQKMSS